MQRWVTGIVWGVMWAVAQAGAASPASLRLLTQDQEPYSVQNADGTQGGIALLAVKCALQKLNDTPDIRFVSWSRAQRQVELGEADGYFPASQNAERDRLAQWFGPAAPQEWRWYLRRDSKLDPAQPDFRSQARVGAYAGSNMAKWLDDNQYQISVRPPEHDQLLDVLLAGRADAVLAANLAMDKLIAQQGAGGKVRSVLAQDKPLGLYLSRTFLARQPAGYAVRLQQTLHACRASTGS